MSKKCRPAAGFASAIGMVTTGTSAASRFAIDLTGARFSVLISETRPMLRPGLSFPLASSVRRTDRTQHRFARPTIHLQARLLLVGAERRAGLHSGLAVDLVGVETDAREVTLHGLDVGGAQLA